MQICVLRGDAQSNVAKQSEDNNNIKLNYYDRTTT